MLDELLGLLSLAHPAHEQPAEHADRHDRALDHPDRAGEALVLRGVEVPGIYWHFVDVMWVIVYVTVYIL